MAAAAYVQIVTRSEDRRRRWSDVLTAAGFTVVPATDVSPDRLVDLVLTDQELADESEPFSGLRQHGVVQVAGESPSAGDAAAEGGSRFELDDPPQVSLSADALEREIILACQMLAAVVRLRRGQREASERESRWKELADADPLTGLMNRRAFTERLVEFLRVSGGKKLCCLALLDLDRFKPVNDEVGHSAGDALLRQVAERLGSEVRKGDLVSRLGGDEFAVALFGVSPEIASRLVERLRQAVSGVIVADSRTATASAGWAMLGMPPAEGTPGSGGGIPLSDAGAEALYRDAFEEADANLRAAKSAGRSRTIPC